VGGREQLGRGPVEGAASSWRVGHTQESSKIMG
jgi:hypothetical protein